MNSLRVVLRDFDDWLSRQYSVKEFSQDPKCVLRIQVCPIRHSVDLPDGTIMEGSQTLMIHWWNQRASIIPAEGPTLAWALETSRSMRYSLRLIARYLQDNSACQEIQAVGGITAHVVMGKADGGKVMLEHLGFMVIPYHRPFGAFGEFWGNFFTWWLMWTYNPASTRRRSMFNLQRTEFWTSRRSFIDKYG
ncbi:MAG: YkoP family protein [Anaerolineales bacterium]